MFSRHGFQSPPLLHQSGRLPSHSSLVFIISARFPRARTRQVFFVFLPSPLHLSGTTYWLTNKYVWRFHPLGISSKISVNNCGIGIYEWRLHLSSCTAVVSPRSRFTHQSILSPMCGRSSGEGKAKKAERWSLHPYLTIIQSVRTNSRWRTRRWNLHTHSTVYQRIIPQRWRGEGKKQKNAGRAHARGEMEKGSTKGAKKWGGRIKKQRALPKRKYPLRQRRKTRGALRPHRSRTVRWKGRDSTHLTTQFAA